MPGHIDKEIKGAKKIKVPYSSVASRYAPAVALILDQLHESRAADAKKHNPDEFSWSFDYHQPKDPDTRNEKEFVQKLESKTKVFLIAWGWGWKGGTPINEVPVQVHNRYEERARVICVPQIKPEVELTSDISQLDVELAKIISSLGDLRTKFNLKGNDESMVSIAQTALKVLKK